MSKKLFLVRSEAKAADLRPHFSDEWVIKGIGSTLTGHRFSVILVADQDDRYNTPEKWTKFMGFLRTKLEIGGELIEVY